MRPIALLTLCLFCASAARAAAPDNEYVEIYSAISQADNLQQEGKLALASAKYFQAQAALQKLQAYHPSWNPDVVHYRLEYLDDRLHALSKMGPFPGGTPLAAPAPATPPVAMSGPAIVALQEQIRTLNAANVELVNRLKEALSIQPAAVSPRELAKAEERIVALEKERDLLKVNLEQAGGQKPEAAVSASPSKALTEAKALIAEQKKEIVRLREKAAALEKSLAAAKDEVRLRMKELADAEAHGDADLLAAHASLREAERQRDELASKMALAKTNEDGVKPTVPLADSFRPVIPANSPPATDPAAAPPTTNAAPVHAAHSIKELPPGAGALMADAMRATDAKDYARAEEMYKEILRQDENNVYVLVHLAQTQLAAGRLEECEKTVLRAVKLDPQDAGSLYLLGILRFRQERLDEALEALNTSAKYNPTNSGTQTYLGCVLEEKGQHAQAETTLRRALELDPKMADAHYYLAFVYAAETPSFPALAQWHYERALALGHPKSPELEKKLSPPKQSQ
jgi:tetratricopeptide (TPR) repeat protein